jgi:hypothetical protein
MMGEWHVNNEFLELQGNASKLIIKNSEWQLANREKFRFYSTHRLAIENQE